MIAKRTFDIICSGIGLVALSPLLAAIAVAIRLDSPGPVFFRQIRIGRGCIPFRIHKFRTMRTDQREAAPQITIGRDPRITRVGYFLRRTKLDELPQLLDVLLGDMSIVGPRPEVPCYVDYYPTALKELIFSIRPGITDESSIHFIDETEVLAKQEDPESFYINEIIPIKNAYHANYARNISFMGDILILLSTIKRVAMKTMPGKSMGK